MPGFADIYWHNTIIKKMEMNGEAHFSGHLQKSANQIADGISAENKYLQFMEIMRQIKLSWSNVFSTKKIAETLLLLNHPEKWIPGIFKGCEFS